MLSAAPAVSRPVAAPRLLSTFTAFCMESFDAGFLSGSTQGVRGQRLRDTVRVQPRARNAGGCCAAIAAGVIRAVRTVHLCGYAHRYIKSNTVLCDGPAEPSAAVMIVLSNFG